MLESKRVKETLVIKDIESTAKTLREMVDYLKEESQGKDEEMNRIIRVSHPIVNRIKQVLGVDYNIYIEGIADLEALLNARGYRLVEGFPDSYWERTFNRSNSKVVKRIFIEESLFEEGKLKYIKQADWDDNFIKTEETETKNNLLNDDLPF